MINQPKLRQTSLGFPSSPRCEIARPKHHQKPPGFTVSLSLPIHSLFRILYGPFCEVPPLLNHHFRVSSLIYNLLTFFPLALSQKSQKTLPRQKSHLAKKNPTLWYIARDWWSGKGDVTNRFVGIDWDDNLHLSHCHRRTFQCLLHILCHSTTTFYLGVTRKLRFFDGKALRNKGLTKGFTNQKLGGSKK